MAGTLIGNIWAALRIDGSLAKSDAEKAGGEAGEAAQKAMGARLKTGAKIIGAAVGAGLTVALVGRFNALDRATADFRKETGATADEAARASKAINDMAGRNLQPIEEIGQVLTKVHTDLGLTGDEAERVAEQFLKYGQATGQNAADATLAFDDILDAWGLTAKDATGIMDALIVSHQRYGGSIADNQHLLASLAPALKAANLSWEDANGLLNLFARSGVEAESATTAFNRAVTKVKSPEQLQQMLTDIANTDDAFKRAQLSADLFGTRAGPKLANALADSGGDLGAFTVKLDDAKGATDKAADASLTLADKIKLAFSNIVSGATDILGPAGPLLTAIGGLAPLLGPALSKAWKAVVGNFGLKAAIGAAGAAAGAIYSGAEAVVSAIISGIAAVWGKVATSPIVNGAVALAGEAAGVIYAGTSAGAGFLKGFLGRLAGSNLPLLLAPLLVGQGGQETFGGTDPKVVAAIRAMADDQLKEYVEFTRAHGDEASIAVANAVWNERVLANAGKNAVAITTTWGTTAGKAAGDSAGRAMTAAVVSSSAALRAAASQSWSDAIEAARGVVRRAQDHLVNDFAMAPVDMFHAIQNGKKAIVSEFRDMEWQIAHPEAGKKFEDWLQSKYDLAMAHAKNATKNGRPELAAQWRGVADDIKAQIDGLPAHAVSIQRQIAASLAAITRGIATTIAAVDQAATSIASIFGPPGHAASGGYHSGPTWVGERGPELLDLPRGSYVHNATESAAMVAPGAPGPSRIDFYVHDQDGGLARSGIGVSELARQIAEAFRGASDSAHIGSLRPRGA